MKVKDAALKSIVRGAGILFFSGIVVRLIRFFYRLITSRYLGPADYGLLSLGIMVLNVVALLSLIGLDMGTIRYVSFYNSKGDKSRIKGTLLSTLKISSLIGIVFALILVIFSEQIAVNLFHNASFRPILIIFSLIVPFYAIQKLLSKTFTAFKKPEYSFFASALGRDLLLLILALFVVFFGGSVMHLSFATMASVLFSLIITIFLFEKYVFPLMKKIVKPVYEYRKLLSFSLPLFLSVIFLEILGWADTFILNFFKGEVAVGVYNVALPLATGIGIFLTSFSAIFFPIISGLTAKNKTSEVGHVYSVVARWIFFLSFPVALLFVFFPGTIISKLFGENYIAGSIPLVILVIGYFINVITGPTFEVLKTFNKSRFVFYVNSSMAVLNVILNIILIPLYGLVGAAIATSVSLVIRELMFFFKTKKYIKPKFEFKYYAKYIVSAAIPLAVIYFVLTKFFHPFSVIELIVALVVFGVSYLFLLLIFRSITEEDMMILFAVEKKFGINLKFVKRLIKKFT